MLPLAEIARLAALQGQEINEAKKVLANEATAMVHGRTAADAAADTARKTFEEGALAETLPTVTMPRAHIATGLKIQNAFVAAGLAKSNGEVNRAIGNKAIAVNDERITANDHVLREKDITPEGVIKLSLGKKRHVLLRPE